MLIWRKITVKKLIMYSFQNVWISNRNCSKSQYLIVWGFFKTKNHSWHLFFSWQSARPRKQKKKWRQASLLVNLLLSFLKIKTWEFFSRIAQFFNLQIGFTWKFHLSRHSRFRRPSLFPHSLPADFSPSLTNLVNTIYKGKTAQNFIL